jgi:high affinity Mn2+ porin
MARHMANRHGIVATMPGLSLTESSMQGCRPQAAALALMAACLLSPLAGHAEDAGSDAPAAAPEPDSWNAHFQSTYVFQKKPGFNSPYEGPNSLSGSAERSYSFTATAAFGLRLGRATEVYFNPEVAQGVALSNLLGLGAFTNGELAKTSGANPTFYVARLFARHTFSLGGETEAVESDANQLAGVVDKRRIVVTAGKISVIDAFDDNSLSHDPRTQFMNWALMTHGAYDYAADSRGYTSGFMVEGYHDDWSWRVGRFMQPVQPNGLPIDTNIWKHYGDQIEVGKDYSIAGQKGTVRVMAFRNHAIMARYTDALSIAAAAGPGTVPTLDSARQGTNNKVGVGLNVEHHFTEDLGVFARGMWADGKTETYAFTEIDRSLSAGVVVNGDRWGRHDDTVGLAFASDYLSKAHRQFLAQGGTTFFLGDGRLNYGPERLVEAYYRVGISKTLSFTLDAQRIMNPGYNRDRGPVNFVAARLHWEY